MNDVEGVTNIDQYGVSGSYFDPTEAKKMHKNHQTQIEINEGKNVIATADFVFYFDSGKRKVFFGKHKVNDGTMAQQVGRCLPNVKIEGSSPSGPPYYKRFEPGRGRLFI